MSRFQHTRLAPARLTLVAAFVAALVVGGCSCKDPPLIGPDGGVTACATHQECQEELGSRFLCLDGICCPGPRYCEDLGEAECCPAQSCNRGGVCVDKYDACEADVDCAAAGQRCLPRTSDSGGAAECGGEGQTATVCTFELCDASGGCANGLTCFAGYCVGENPCGGSCPGQVCSVSNNRCQAAPDGNTSCAQSCEPGFLLAFADPGNIDDACDLSTVTCECFPLPPLTARDVGRHSGVAVLSDGSAVVSAFDGDHGDLVVVEFDSGGQRLATTWIDGLPSGGTPVADPSGPRGGIADPGPEVGRYTDIVASGATLHVSYYDVDAGALKYARRDAGSWSHHTVDDNGDVGRYTSIALDPVSGAPVIAYFQASGAPPDENNTSLKVARADSASPAAGGDWTFVAVDTTPTLPPPCGGSCPAGSSCADVGGGPECLTDRSDCAPACGSGEVCIDSGGAAACELEQVVSGLDDLPFGVGLFPSLSVTSTGGIAVAYYDRINADLKLALGVDPTAGSPGTITTIDGGADKDVGLFPALGLEAGGSYVVIYQDAVADSVLWATVSSAGTVIDRGTVDDGLRNPENNGPSIVGADNTLVLDGGRWHVAYQDGTGGDLLLASRATDGTWSRQQLVTEGAAGFWADAGLQGGRLYVSHVLLRGARTGPLFTDLRVEVLTP